MDDLADLDSLADQARQELSGETTSPDAGTNAPTTSTKSTGYPDDTPETPIEDGNKDESETPDEGSEEETPEEPSEKSKGVAKLLSERRKLRDENADLKKQLENKQEESSSEPDSDKKEENNEQISALQTKIAELESKIDTTAKGQDDIKYQTELSNFLNDNPDAESNIEGISDIKEEKGLSWEDSRLLYLATNNPDGLSSQQLKNQQDSSKNSIKGAPPSVSEPTKELGKLTEAELEAKIYEETGFRNTNWV